jgi:hypothetical protein
VAISTPLCFHTNGLFHRHRQALPLMEPGVAAWRVKELAREEGEKRAALSM